MNIDVLGVSSLNQTEMQTTDGGFIWRIIVTYVVMEVVEGMVIAAKRGC